MSQINSNTKDDFQVVLLLSCFVGHPVPKMAILEFVEITLTKKFNNLILFNIGFPCSCCFFTNIQTRKIINIFKSLKKNIRNYIKS